MQPKYKPGDRVKCILYGYRYGLRGTVFGLAQYQCGGAPCYSVHFDIDPLDKRVSLCELNLAPIKVDYPENWDEV